MASADQTLSDSGGEFEADATQHLASLVTPGGFVRCTGTVDAVIDPNGGTVSSVSQPVGSGKLFLKAGGIDVPLPVTCQAFSFKASASTFIQYHK